MQNLSVAVAQTLYGLLGKVTLSVTSPSFLEDSHKLHAAKIELEAILQQYQQQDNNKIE